MASINDLFFIDSNTAKAEPSPAGTVRTLCSADLCGSKTLTVRRHTMLPNRQQSFDAADGYQLIYVMSAAKPGSVNYRNESHAATEGAGVLLAPGESARFESKDDKLDLLQLAVPKPPAAIDNGLPGGPGYYFDRTTLRALSDASGGRVRRFCAESSVRLADGSRLTVTNAIQAGEMHYNEGGASPYHSHSGTPVNPGGADHCYMTFKGRGRVEVEGDTRDIEPGTLVYFPPGIPHRLRALDGPLDYFEIQAWRSFKTSVLSEEPLGLRWYYERERPGADLVEWNQS
jgi:mannose-6-phosphate isomerase-like protein (cupin superfamily)